MTSPPIRVVRVIARMNVGGPARHLIALSESMRGPVDTVIVTGLAAGCETDMSQAAVERGIETIVHRGLQRALSPRDALVVMQLCRLFRRLRPDVIETHTSKAGAVGRAAAFLYRWLTPGALLGRPRRVAVVHVFHGHVFHGYFSRRATALFLAVERLLARVTGAIIVLSERQRREIAGDYAVAPFRKFHVIPLAVDFSEIPAQPPPVSESTTVGIVGRLTRIKNHELFLRAAAQMKDEPRVRFSIYGDGEERERLESLVHTLGLGSRVTFHGTRPVGEIYRSIDLAVLTSDNEGTPLSIIEAMGAGIPVISTEVGGVADLLGDAVGDRGGTRFTLRERGITVPPGDGPALAQAIRRLAGDPSFARGVGEAGRLYARATFDPRPIAARIIALYQNLLAAQTRRGAKARE